VKPEGESFDALGRGDEEGKPNFGEVSGKAANKSLDMIRQVSSSGYLRKRLPQELVLLQGGMGNVFGVETATGTIGDPVGDLTSLVPESKASIQPMDARAKAKMQGYEGDACGECGNYTLVRNGTCMKCNTCGGTSGCS